MTQDEAEKLARWLYDIMKLSKADRHGVRDGVKSICNHILSGDMKREIENAAYINAANRCSNGRVGKWCASQIRSLIQPPAQQKDAELKAREAGR